MTIKLIPCVGDAKYCINLESNKPMLPFKRFNVCIISKNKSAILKPLIHNGNYIEQYEFFGPYIEDVDRILISPEDDAWTLKKVELKDGTKVYEFVPNGTVELSPSKKEPFSAERKELYDKEYLILKANILSNTRNLILFGSLVEVFIDQNRGIAFAIGGAMGLGYITLLQKDIEQRSGRLAVLIVVAYLVLNGNKDIVRDDYQLLLSGSLGFFMYKLGMLLAYFEKK